MSWRSFALPVVAVALVAAVLGVQLASGGARYLPTTPSSACRTAPALPASSADLDAVTQVVVVDGVRRAACRLGTSRERLLLALPSESDRAALARELGVSDAELLAELRSGLLEAVDRLDRAGALPPVSSLLDDIAGQLGLPDLAVAAIKQIPPSAIDELLPTGPTLGRAIAQVDLAKVLSGVTDADSLERALVPAIRDAAIAEARARLADKVGGISGMLGIG